ncbi:MAG: L-histidine N(alpha)-methyltransferase [Brevundimonas sp.]|uniref:L-histidine N(alpha)-methyltransferase n=1 Tax=Brevundimonas sp. TaxID=1871086 RepID=UPI003919BD05
MFDAEPNLADFDFAASVAHSLSLRPRRLASKWLYDDAGAALFEGIVASDNYYGARAEREILRTHGPDIARALGAGGSLVELGSGASVKVRHLLDAMPDLTRYVPVDISQAQLLASAAAIRRDYPDLEVVPISADFTKDFDLSAIVGDSLVLGFFPGTTLCNFLPENSEAFLRRMHGQLGPDSLFLAGVDLQKDPEVLRRAYNDPGGAIWDFNLNIVDRINRELGADLDKADFRHEAIYNTEAHRIEAGIYPLRDLSLTIAGQTFDLPAGQPIVLEYSHKYTLDSFAALAARAGWRTLDAWTDSENLYSVHLLTNRTSA